VIAASAIVRTQHTSEWASLLGAIGLERDHTGTRFTADGVVTLEPSPDEGFELEILTSSAADAVERLRTAGIASSTDPGGSVVVHPASGPRFVLSPSAVGPAQGDGRISVMPIWYGPELGAMRSTLGALGLRESLAADSGVWYEFDAPDGGRVALHADTVPRVELAFSCRDDLDALSASLRRAGFAADVVDEAYNRTVQARTPGGGTLHLNGPIEDLYGFHRVG
jgi:hypothetical protein